MDIVVTIGIDEEEKMTEQQHMKRVAGKPFFFKLDRDLGARVGVKHGGLRVYLWVCIAAHNTNAVIVGRFIFKNTNKYSWNVNH